MTGLEDKLGVLIGYWNEDDVKAPARAPNWSDVANARKSEDK